MSSFLKWKTKDGRVIAIADMSDSHLLSAFRYSREKFKEYTAVEWFPGISGFPRNGLRMSPFLEEFYKETQKRQLEWKFVVPPSLDGMFVSAADARKKPTLAAPPPVQPPAKFVSLDLGEPLVSKMDGFLHGPSSSSGESGDG